MIRPAALLIAFPLVLAAGKAANIVAGSGLKPTASSVGVLQLLSPPATAGGGGFSLSSAAPSHTHDGAVSDTPLGGPAANAVGLLSVGAVGSADPRPDAGASAYMDARSRTDGAEPSVPDRLLSAIEFVESRGRADAIGDGGRAVGILQIHAGVVADCNAVAGYERFTLADRLDPEKSREMFRVYIGRWCPNGTDEQKARVWNGGPRGASKAATVGYWNRVRAEMVR